MSQTLTSVVTTQSDNQPTIISIGVLAATLAALWHETIGHGLGCVAVGGQITLLTSIWFRCHDATALTDAGGPIASLIAGVVLLPWAANTDRALRLLLILFGAINLFWFSSQLIFHALRNTDDWFFVARQMGWPPFWRPISVALGVAAYVLSIKVTTAALPRTGPPMLPAIRLAYAAGVASAVVAGLMWQPDAIRSGFEGFTTLGIALFGVLVAARRADRETTPRPAGTPIALSWVWIVLSVVVFVAFAAVQGRGLGPLAGVALHR